MSNNNYLVAMILVALTALASCGSANSGAHQPALTAAAVPFQVSVMPETYALGGSAQRVVAVLDPVATSADQLVVDIRVEGARELKSVYLTLSYDAQQYRALAAAPTALMGEPGSLLSLYMPTQRGSIEYGQVLVHPDGRPGLSGSGSLARISFSRQPEVPGRTVSSAGPPVTMDSQVSNLVFDGTNLTWSYFQLGDYDQNGETNVADLTPLGQHFKEMNPPNVGGVKWPLALALSQIDGDNNSEINAADITPIGKGFKYDSVGGFHVFKSATPAAYPAGIPPLGANGAGAIDLTLAPGSAIAITAAVNYSARSSERIKFTFGVTAPLAGDFYWVRPADASGVFGIASNLVGGNPATSPVLSLDPATPTPPTAGDGSQAFPFLLVDSVNYNFKLLAAPGGADVTHDLTTVFKVTPTGAGTFTANVLDVTSGFNGVYVVTASYNAVQNHPSSNVYCRSGSGPTPPTVLSTLPADGASAVESTVAPSATFSAPMDPQSLSSTTFTLKHGATAVAGVVSYVGVTATFTPAVKLDPDTLYTATITTGARNLAGTALAADYVWTFHTALVDLGAAQAFGTFGGGAGMTNQGLFTVVDGDIATTGVPTMITGFHDSHGNVYTETPLNAGLVTGRIMSAPPPPGTAEQFAIATQGAIDAQNAYDKLSPAQMPGGTDPGAGELGGLTLFPGIYQAAGGTFQLTGSDLTLDAQGDANATWVFQCASSLTIGDVAPRSIVLINGAQARNVYWQVGSMATINGAGGGRMVGTIIASAGVTFSTAGNVTLTVLDGRAIGLHASVTLVNTRINVPK